MSRFGRHAHATDYEVCPLPAPRRTGDDGRAVFLVERFPVALEVRGGETVLRLGEVSDLARRRRTIAEIGGLELLILCVRGRFTVIENRCPHLGSTLTDARVVGRTLTCAKHGFKFALVNGALISSWRSGLGKSGRLNLFRTRVEGKDLLLSLAGHEDEFGVRERQLRPNSASAMVDHPASG